MPHSPPPMPPPPPNRRRSLTGWQPFNNSSGRPAQPPWPVGRHEVGYPSTSSTGGPARQPRLATHYSPWHRPTVARARGMRGTTPVPPCRQVKPRHQTRHQCVPARASVARPRPCPREGSRGGPQGRPLGGDPWACNNAGCIGRPSPAPPRCSGALRTPHSPS